MSKRTVINLSLWGLAVMAPGLVLLPACIGALAARDPAFDVGDSYGRAMLALLVSTTVFLTVGVVVEIIAWWRAVRLTESMGYRDWQRALLWGGLIGILTMPLFGLGLLFFGSVMLAYLVSGPARPGMDVFATTPSKQLIGRRIGQGWVLAGVGLGLAIVVGNLTHPGLPFHGLVWPSMVIESLGMTILGLGAVCVGAAWWGALFNAYLLPDLVWFKRLRWTGVVAAATMPALGLGAVVIAVVLGAWVRSAPDGTADRSPLLAPTPTLLSPHV